MNASNAKDYLPLVQALAEAKVIQWRNSAGNWEDSRELSDLWTPDHYRIKPEPREIWVNEWKPAGKVVFDSAEDAAEHAKRYGIGHVTTRYREVIE